MNINCYLEDIERRINAEEEDALLKEWTMFADGKISSNKPFRPMGRVPKPSGLEWPKININDAINDESLMILSQFAGISKALADGSYRLHMIRSNYGVGIIPTIFGSEVFMMPREHDCLPNVRTLIDGQSAISRFVEEDFPDFKNGFGANVLSIGEKYMEIKEKYPHIRKYVWIDHPDCQGPFDICELLCGSGIFYELYDNPDLIHKLLRKVTDFYKAFLDKWFSIVPNKYAYHTYAGLLHKGAVCIRDDSAMNLSPAFYEEFIYPYDYEALKYFGGGAIHFCGRGDHYIEKMSEMDCLYAVDLSQPHYNNMDWIFQNTIGKGRNLFTAGGSHIDNAKDGKYQYSKIFLF